MLHTFDVKMCAGICVRILCTNTHCFQIDVHVLHSCQTEIGRENPITCVRIGQNVSARFSLRFQFE